MVQCTNERWCADAAVASLREFFSTNEIVVVFGYGLVFFLLGFALTLQARRPSQLTMARALPLLGSFGLLHGVAEWGPVFIPIQATYLRPERILALWVMHGTLLAMSFAFLMQFGLRLAAEGLPKRYQFLPALAWVVFGVWLALYLWNGPFLQESVSIVDWLDAGDAWSRLMLAFPGGLITCYGLSRQADEFRRMGTPHLLAMLRMSVLSFGLFAVAGGLVVPYADFFPARHLNTETFFELTGLPAELLRGLAGLAIIYFVTRMLEVFNVEQARRMEEAERVEAVLEERDRIARELHDGIIQRLYAVGLNLEAIKEQLEEDPAECKLRLQFVLENLNESIRDIRHYIANLRSPRDEQRTLQEALAQIAGEFRAAFGVSVTLETRGDAATVLRPEVLNHLRQITRESITNAIRHGKASRIRIVVDAGPSEVSVAVTDDGSGFSLEQAEHATGQGLRNMRQRAQLMGGRVRIDSAPGRGTTVAVTVPLEAAVAPAGQLARSLSR